MTPAARIAAAAGLLDSILEGVAAEQALTYWARRNRYAGSGDRAAIRDLVFDTLRCRRSYAALGGASTGRALMLGRLRALGEDPTRLFTGEGYGLSPLTPEETSTPVDLADQPDGIRLDLPDWLLPTLRDSLGDGFEAIAERLRHRAEVGLRVNLARADHEAADRALLKDGIESEPHPLATMARVVTANPRRIKGSSAYRDGLVELQDPASQAVIEALLPIPKAARILDYCAGGGGKALALAAATGAEIFAHDINPKRMRDIPERAARAGAVIHCVTGAEIRQAAPWDLILVDAPCSGSGAWRRQPEAKWTLDAERLAALTHTQSQILEDVAPLVAQGGVLAYATCSLLRCENSERIDQFMGEKRPGWSRMAQRTLTPLDGGDGFFWTHLKRE